MTNGNPSKKKRAKAEASTGNVFADLELSEAYELAAKSKLIAQISVLILELPLTETVAAKRLGVTNVDLSAALRGDLDRFSIGELKNFIQTLGIGGKNRTGATKVKKIPLSDGSGNWFDLTSAKEFHESISTDEMLHRGFRDGDWEFGETLYYTKKGTFVLCHWTRSHDTFYFPISNEAAVRWLISNGYEKDVQQMEFQSEERKLEV